MTDAYVEKWLSTRSESTARLNRCYFAMFQDFIKLSGEQLVKNARANLTDPDKIDDLAIKVIEWRKLLLSGTVKCKKRGSMKGKRGGKLDEYTEKPLSQNTVKNAVAVVQSFFAFHNLPLNLKKFNTSRALHPQAEKRKRLLLPDEISKLMRIADSRAKAILALGLMGMDESTVSSLKIENFEAKLGADKLEFIDLQRPKTGLPIKLVLTCETQNILADYITSLHRHEGCLFSGYQQRSLAPYQCNAIFKALCLKAGMVENGKRLSFHGLRMTFATRLRNKISDDIIDLLMGHAVRYGSAYLADDEEKLRELLSEAGIEDLLRLQEAPQLELSKELEQQSKIIQAQQERIKLLEESDARSHREMIWMRKRLESMGYKTPVRDVKEYKPSEKSKSEVETLRTEVDSLRAKIEKLMKQKAP